MRGGRDAVGGVGAGGAAVGADGVRPGLGRGDPEPEVLPSHASDPGGEAVGRDRFVPLRVTDENVVFQVASDQVFSAGTWIVASHRSPIVRGLWGGVEVNSGVRRRYNTFMRRWIRTDTRWVGEAKVGKSTSKKRRRKLAYRRQLRWLR